MSRTVKATLQEDKSMYLKQGFVCIEHRKYSKKGTSSANDWYRFCQEQRVPYVVLFPQHKGRSSFQMELDTIAWPISHDLTSPVSDWIAEALVASLESLPRNGEIGFDYGPDTCLIDSLETTAARALAERIGNFFVKNSHTIVPLDYRKSHENLFWRQWYDLLNLKIAEIARRSSLSIQDQIREVLSITWADGFLMGQGEHPGNPIEPDDVVRQILSIRKEASDVQG